MSGKQEVTSLPEVLTKKEVAQLLKISPRTFDQHRPKLVAMGLKSFNVGRSIRFLTQSVLDVIQIASDTGQAL
ncbi:MAG: helix-turn-helix domain-containing protein [Anaerohalosphaeraceae bacterium]